MNTWKRAQLDTEDKKELRNSKTKEQSLNKIQTRNRNTWISPNGQISRQIDYIIINHAYRNIVTRTWPIKGWRGTMTQQRQHATIRMDITLRCAKNFFRGVKETGKKIKYDLQEVRNIPNKLKTWYANRCDQEKEEK